MGAFSAGSPEAAVRTERLLIQRFAIHNYLFLDLLANAVQPTLLHIGPTTPAKDGIEQSPVGGGGICQVR
jgi:hypothetical protein